MNTGSFERLRAVDPLGVTPAVVPTPKAVALPLPAVQEEHTAPRGKSLAERLGTVAADLRRMEDSHLEERKAGDDAARLPERPRRQRETRVSRRPRAFFD